MSEYDRRGIERRADDEQLTGALDSLGMSLEPTAEWQIVLALLRGSWPGALSRSDALAYSLVLGDLPVGDVARGVRDLARQGRKYRPTAPEIRSYLGADTDADSAPTFDEAWAAVCRSGITSRWDAGSALLWLEEMAGSAVASWARSRGLPALWKLPSEDPDHGRFVRRDLERSWEGFAEAWSIPARRAQLSAARAGELRSFRPALPEAD